ncbi:MAG: sulfite exporter TauE/SafE family protein [Chitinophagaceae bacterium]
MYIGLIIIFICSFLAYGISALCGGGAGLILIPLLGIFLPVSHVPAALSIGTFTGSMSRLVVFRKHICWHIVKYFLPLAIPAVWVGAWLLKFVNPVYLEMVMGIFLVSNLPFLFKKPKVEKSTHKPKNILLSLIGFLSGFLSGLTGAVGLLFNRFYFKYGLTQKEVVATRAANEIILHLIKIVLYTLFGLISTQVVWLGIVVAVAAIFSTWAMKWILPKLSERLFKKIGYSAMVFSGLMLLFFSGKDIFKMYDGDLYGVVKKESIEIKLNWGNRGYSLEFSYDDGFEFEFFTPFSDLSPEYQN